MRKIINWFKESNRWKHLLGGAIIGALSNDWYCAALAGTCTAGALEYKDWAKGGKFDIIDFLLTIVGVAIGFTIMNTIINLIN